MLPLPLNGMYRCTDNFCCPANAAMGVCTCRLLISLVTIRLPSSLTVMIMMWCGAGFYEKMSAKLGPDPLREDADGEVLWAKMQASRKPVGLILMDQSAVAGVGNIFRAEILFKVCQTFSPTNFVWPCPRCTSRALNPSAPHACHFCQTDIADAVQLLVIIVPL